MSWRDKQAQSPAHLSRPVQPRVVRLHPLQRVLPHTHVFGQLMYSDNTVLTIQTLQGEFVVPRHQALWVPPGIEHCVTCRDGGQLQSLYVDAGWGSKLGTRVKALEVDSLLQALLGEVTSWQDDFAMSEENQRLLMVLVDRLHSARENPLFLPKAQDKRLSPIVNALCQQPGLSHSLEEWGSQVGASSRTLNRLFNQAFGMGFSAWRQKVRVMMALKMLGANQSNSEIAEALGYESSSAFIQAFKAHMPYPPGYYRSK